MTALEKMREWLKTYSGFNVLESFQVDFTDGIPANGGISPNGLIEVDRQEDVLGNAIVTNQYNFGVCCVFAKPPGDDVEATINADWMMEFQEWVQEQSATGMAPIFGDEPKKEKIMAQNGAMYEASKDGWASYMVQISVQFIKKYEVKNKWLT